MKCSLHVHSNYSDGTGTISEIVESAKKLGIDELGISDHFRISQDGICLAGDMPLGALESYVADVLSFSNLRKPVVRLGLEVEFVPGSLEKLKDAISNIPIDYLIGSVHGIDTLRIDCKNESLSADFYSNIMRRYWILIRQMAESRLFDIVGHMDVVKKFGYSSSVDFSKEIDEALHSILKADMVVELNTSGWYYPCNEQYPSVDILKKCVDLKIPLTVSADSHSPENLSRGFDRAYELLRNLGVSKQSYFIKRKRFFTEIP